MPSQRNENTWDITQANMKDLMVNSFSIAGLPLDPTELRFEFDPSEKRDKFVVSFSSPVTVGTSLSYRPVTKHIFLKSEIVNALNTILTANSKPNIPPNVDFIVLNDSLSNPFLRLMRRR